MTGMIDTIHERIRLKRHAAGLTQQKLADLTGVKRGVVNAYEHGKSLPNLEWLSKFILICKTNYDYIIDGTGANESVVNDPLEPYSYGFLDLINGLEGKIDKSHLNSIRKKLQKLLTEIGEKQLMSIHLLEQQKDIIELLQAELHIKIKDK